MNEDELFGVLVKIADKSEVAKALVARTGCRCSQRLSGRCDNCLLSIMIEDIATLASEAVDEDDNQRKETEDGQGAE